MKGFVAVNKAFVVALLSVSVLLIESASCSSRKSQAGKVVVVVNQFPTHGVANFMHAVKDSDAYVTFMLNAEQAGSEKSASYVDRATRDKHDFGYVMTEPKEGASWEDAAVTAEIKEAKANFKKNFSKVLKFVLFPNVEDETVSKRLEGLAKKASVSMVKPTIAYPSFDKIRRTIRDDRSDSCIVLIDNDNEGEKTLGDVADRVDEKRFEFVSLADFVKAKVVDKKALRGYGRGGHAARGRLAEGKSSRKAGSSSTRKAASKLINDSETVLSAGGRRIEGKSSSKRTKGKAGSSSRKTLINASEEIRGGRADGARRSKKASRNGKGSKKPLVNESDLPTSVLAAFSGDAKKKTMPTIAEGGAQPDGAAALAVKAGSGYILPGRELLKTRPIPKGGAPIVLAAKGAAKVSSTVTPPTKSEGHAASGPAEGSCKKDGECPVAH